MKKMITIMQIILKYNNKNDNEINHVMKKRDKYTLLHLMNNRETAVHSSPIRDFYS